jgi:hypothetical protein
MIKIIGGLASAVAIAAMAYFLYQTDKQASDAIQEDVSVTTGVNTIIENKPIQAVTDVEKNALPTEIPDNLDDVQVQAMLVDIERMEALVKEDIATIAASGSMDDKPVVAEQALFNIVAQPETIPAPPNMEGIVASQWIELDVAAMQTLQKGSRFEIPAVGKNAYQVVIADKKTLWNGDSSIKGKVYDETGESFPLILSVGTNTSYMSYSTPEGSFEAELKDGQGAIYSVSEIDRITENGKHEDVIQDIREMRK